MVLPWKGGAPVSSSNTKHPCTVNRSKKAKPLDGQLPPDVTKAAHNRSHTHDATLQPKPARPNHASNMHTTPSLKLSPVHAFPMSAR